MSKGWMALHRQSQNHWLYQEKPFDRWHAWEDLLLSANHEQNTFLHGNTLLTVERGQFVTSLRKLGDRWGWGQEKVRRFLNLLVSDAMIQIECDTTKTVVTIENYSFFQDVAAKARHERDTNETRTNTNNNENNENNENNTRDKRARTRFTPPTLEEVETFCKERGSRVVPQEFIDFYASKGWMVGKTRMTDWKAACRRAEKWERWDKLPAKPRNPRDINYDEEF